jgi:hypothetical protein
VQSGQRYTPAQVSQVAASTAAGDFFDAKFVGAFVGTDVARPFFGSKAAPVTSVGAFAGDACFIFGITGTEPVCTISPTQLVSVNALNQPGGLSTVVPVSANQVRFIINGGSAESVFGTPFGNVPRNPVQDDMANIGNLSVSKRFKLTERASFEFRTTAVNVLNHPNFLSIDPFLENGGLFAAGTGFGNPQVSDTLPFGINFPVSASRRLIFGGTIRF